MTIVIYGMFIEILFYFIGGMSIRIIFIIILGYGAKNMVSVPITSVGGAADTGNFLSFASSVVGYNPSWVTCSSDYAVNQVTRKKRFCFLHTDKHLNIYYVMGMELVISASII